MKKINQHWQKIVFTIFLILGVFLRFNQLGENPISPYWDEAAIALDAYSFNQTGKDMNNMSPWQPVFGSYGDFKAPVLIWLASLSVKFFGYNLWALRMPVAVASVMSLFIFYYLIKLLLSFEPKLKEKYALLPLIAFAILAISPWPVHYGRIAFESSLSVLFLLLTLLFFFLGMRKSQVYYFPAVLSACIAVYSYYSLRVVLPLMAVALLLIYWQKLRQHLLSLIVCIVLFGLLILPIFKSPYYERSQNYRINNNNIITHQQIILESSQLLERYNNAWWAKLLYHRYLMVSRDFTINLLSHYDLDFLFLSGDTNLRQHSGYWGEFLIVFLPFYILGLLLLVKERKSKFVWTISALAITAPIPSAMVYEVPHASRAIYLFIPISILIAWGINELLISSFKWKKIAIIFLSLAIITNAFLYYCDYFIEYPKRSSEAWLYPYQQASIYIKDHYGEFSEIKVDGRYWLPEIFQYYQMPELVVENQALKNAMLNDPRSSFGLADPYKILAGKVMAKQIELQRATPGSVIIRKPKAEIIFFEVEIPKGFVKIAEFNLATGEPSLILVVEDMTVQNMKTN